MTVRIHKASKREPTTAGVGQEDALPTSVEPAASTKQGRKCLVCGGVFASALCPTDGQPL